MTFRRLGGMVFAATLAVVLVLVALLRDGGPDVDVVESPPGTQLIARVGLEIDPSSGTYSILDTRRRGDNKPLNFASQAFADDEVNVNSQITLIDLQFPRPGTIPPGGTFPITAIFEHTGQEDFTRIFFRVAILEYVRGGEPLPEIMNAEIGGSRRGG